MLEPLTLMSVAGIFPIRLLKLHYFFLQKFCIFMKSDLPFPFSLCMTDFKSLTLPKIE